MTSESEASSGELKQRVVELERQRVHSLQGNNRRCSELEQQVTHLRMLLEQSEATRRQRDLQAAAAKSQVEERMATQSAEVGALRRKKLDLEGRLASKVNRVGELESALVQLQKDYEARIAALASGLHQKDSDLTAAVEQLSRLKSKRSATEHKFAEKESLVSSLQSRLDRLANENISQRETIAQQLEKLEHLVSQNQEQADQVKHQSIELAELRERVEAERSSHLQSKFNCEVIQLRLKDVETAAESERAARNEAALNTNLLTEQLKEAQERLREEQATVISLSTQLSEHISSTRALEESHRQLCNKKESSTAKLSKQLKDEQTMAGHLRSVVEKAEAKCSELNDHLTKLANQVQKTVRQGHTTLGSGIRKVSVRAPVGRESLCTKDVDELVTALAGVAKAYEDRVSQSSAMISSLSAKVDSVTATCDDHKQTITSTERTMERAEQKMHDLQTTIQSQVREISRRDEKLSDLRRQLGNLEALAQGQKDKLKTNKAELKQMRNLRQADDEARFKHVHTLYLRLSAMNRHQPDTHRSSATSGDELLALVDTEMRLCSEQLQASAEKVKKLDALVQQRNEEIKRLHELHEESLSKVSAATASRETVWQQQRDSQESHMAGLMKEVEDRMTEAHQMLAEVQAELDGTKMERDRYQEGEATSKQLAEELRMQGVALRAVAGLLCSCLWPMCLRMDCMTTEKEVILGHSRQLQLAVVLSEELATAISEELSSPAGSCNGSTQSLQIASNRERKPRIRSPSLHPLLAFRKLAIAVMAFNRFRRILQFSSSLCIARDCPFGSNQRLPVWVCGGLVSEAGHSMSGSAGGYRRHRQQKLTDWVTFLNSSEYLSKVTASSENLTSLLEDTTGLQRGRKPSATLQLCARDQLSRVIRGLDENFQASSLWHVDGRDDMSTVKALERGLQHCMNVIKSRDSRSSKFRVYEQPVAFVSRLHSYITNLTHQLHTAEVQSHRHQQKIIELQQALKNANQQFSVTSKRLLSAEHKASSLVPVDRFESVCAELNASLERERQQQLELAEQREALLIGKHKRDTLQADKSRQESALQKAIQNLTDGSQLINTTEESLRESRQHVSRLQEQEKAMRLRLSEARDSLVIINREKMSLLSYLEAVRMALETVKSSDMSSDSVGTTLKKVVMSPGGLQDGSDFNKCAGVLSSFIELLLALSSKLSAREQDLALHVSHVNTLRRELNSACRRQLSEAAVQLAESVVTDSENGYGEIDLSKLEHLLEGKTPPSGKLLHRMAPLQGEPDLPRATSTHRTRGSEPASSQGARHVSDSGKSKRSIAGLGADLSANLSAAISSS